MEARVPPHLYHSLAEHAQQLFLLLLTLVLKHAAKKQRLKDIKCKPVCISCLSQM